MSTDLSAQRPESASSSDSGAGSSEPARRRIRLVLQYDGTEFHGWQRQAELRTIQAAVEDTLATIVGEPTIVHASGRTDAGVHALGQVAHFETTSRLPAETFKRALNARLPHDVAVARSTDAALDFHARFSAVRKTYCYQFHLGDYEHPFRRRYYLHQWRALDIGAMRAAARQLVGTHDFKSFAAQAVDREDTVRTVYALRVLPIRQGVRVFATGSGFLQHMVRALAGLLLKIGRHKLDIQDAGRILAAKDRREAPSALPAHGLFLWKVDYVLRRFGVDSQSSSPSIDDGSRRSRSP